MMLLGVWLLGLPQAARAALPGLELSRWQLPIWGEERPGLFSSRFRLELQPPPEMAQGRDVVPFLAPRHIRGNPAPTGSDLRCYGVPGADGR